MSETGDLDALSSRELHDRSVKRALQHGDLKFLWRLLESIPAAEQQAGAPGEGEADLINIAALLHDFVHSGDGAVADALRQDYIEYLKRA
jgi:hypothetical protein